MKRIIVLILILGIVLLTACMAQTATNGDDTAANTTANLTQHPCPGGERSKFCTLEYAPVCGWFDESIQCIKYPCAATYGNGCAACGDEKVEYWTDGECPQ